MLNEFNLILIFTLYSSEGIKNYIKIKILTIVNILPFSQGWSTNDIPNIYTHLPIYFYRKCLNLILLIRRNIIEQ